jgi:hypothetical protein
MADLVEDTGIYPVMVELAACLGAQIEESGLGKMCFLGILPGDVAMVDAGSCEDDTPCGSAWVRLVQVYPSDQFPSPSTTATCATALAYELEIGIVRCVKVMDGEGNLPSVEELVDTTRLQLADMAAMRRAISCCSSIKDRSYVLSAYTPTETGGGVGGGSWNVTVWSL